MNAILAAIAEALAVLERFAAANSSADAIVAVLKLMLGRIRVAAEALAAELEELRAKAEAEREKAKVRMRARRSRTFANVRKQADAISSRARSSSSDLEESKADDDGDARARGYEKLVLRVVAPAADPDQLTTAIEQAVKDSGRWPERPTQGWNHAVNVTLVSQLLADGVNPNVMLDAVRGACARATYEKINGFNFFSGAIARAHAQATAQLALPLNNFKSVGGGHRGRHHSSSEERFRARHQASQPARPADGGGSGGTDLAVNLSVDAAETGRLP